MPLIQSIDLARAERIGANGISTGALNDALARTSPALDWLRARHADGALPLLRLPAQRDDLDGIRAAGQRLAAGATDVVLLGTGGSSLGGQTLAQLSGYKVEGVGALRDGPRLHFMDNLDPDTYGALLAKLPLATTRFVAISKSGSTGETLMQTTAALAAVKKAGLAGRIPELFLGLTEPAKGGKRSGLRVAVRRIPDRDARPRSRHRRALFRAHQCRAAAGGSARPRHRGHPRRRREGPRARA